MYSTVQHLQLNLAIVKCRNPANLFTIARFHYRKGHVGQEKRGERKNYCMWHSVHTFPTNLIGTTPP